MSQTTLMVKTPRWVRASNPSVLIRSPHGGLLAVEHLVRGTFQPISELKESSGTQRKGTAW